ncbi:MAG: DUF167 domain-containing protein [Planctomycetota bacterium]
MLEIDRNEKEIFIRLHVTPNSRKTSIGGTMSGALKISVREPADQGKANAAVLRLLASSLGLKKDLIRIKSGQTSRRKRISISDSSTEIYEALLALGEQ